MYTQIGEFIKKPHYNPLYNKMIDNIINKLNIVEEIEDDIGYKQIVYEYYTEEPNDD